MSERTEGLNDQSDEFADARIVHDCLLAMMGSQRDGEGDERQIFHVQFGGADIPAGVQGRKLWYCLDSPVLTAEPQFIDSATRENADQPGVKMLRCGTFFIDKHPEFDGLSEEEVATQQGESLDEDTMFELALALSACIAQVQAQKKRSIDTIGDTGQYL